MLESFEVLTTSGVVLWSRRYANVSASVINSLIRDVFIEERVLPGAGGADDAPAARNPAHKKDQYALKWTTVKDLGLIFVAVYQSLLHLSWVDKLLDNLKIIFVDLYQDQLRKSNTSVVECDFDPYFDQQLKELENSSDAALPTATLTSDLTPPSSSGGDDAEEPLPPPIPGLLKPQQKQANSPTTSADATPIPTPDTSRPATPASNVAKSPMGKAGSRRSRKQANSTAARPSSAHASSGDESMTRKRLSKGTKKPLRRWNAEGMADEGDEDATLDYSATLSGHETSRVEAPRSVPIDAISPESFGTRTGKGQFLLKDLDDEVHSILRGARNESVRENITSAGLLGSGMGKLSNMFRNVVGGKVLTKEDLQKPLAEMEKHLVNKNVAQEAAVRLREGVERELIGIRTGSFESVEATINASMESSLRKILTPTTSLDLLRSIDAVNKPSTLNPLSPSPRPYVISIVGVNGVGKSTNLSKLAFFLLQNDLKILIAACDTFRSGAVEQLRVHAQNLKELSAREGRGQVELFEKGYGKDAANIARDAVTYATQQGIDLVLIDTAGRRHNDERLMSSLEKFGQLAQPDKILMVGEALVGSDSVAQARNFNAAFGGRRGLDGFIISKCDTVGDMVGTLVSMVHATGIPIVFLGVGQHYGDLRTLNVGWAVKLLMQ